MGFKGGYTFKRFEGAAQPVLHETAVPNTVFLPFTCASLTFAPAVKKGDPVRAGSRIMQTGNKNPFYMCSPVNGTVESVSGDGIGIAADGTGHFEPVEGHTRAPWHLDRSAVFNLFSSSGCSLLFDGLFLSPDECDSARDIIVNAVHNAPLNQSWNPSMAGDPFVFPNGLKTLKALFPEASITIALNKRNMQYFNTSMITNIASLKVVSDRYPQENPVLLSRDVLKKRLVSPEGACDDSVLVVPFFDVVQVAEIMTLGRPFIDRIMMIAGPGVSHPGWFRVRIGTPYEKIRRALLKTNDRGPWRMIRGGLFTGESIETESSSVRHTDTELTVIREREIRELYRFMRPGFVWDSYSKTTVADYVPLLPKQLDTGIHGGERPCVQCNYCDEVCPVNIYPFLIWKYVQAGNIEESFRFRPYDCIGCGLCDYVCPSKIPVSSAVIRAKEAYRDARRADENAD